MAHPYGYLQPTPKQTATMHRLREAAAEYAAVLDELLPPGVDKSLRRLSWRTHSVSPRQGHCDGARSETRSPLGIRGPQAADCACPPQANVPAATVEVLHLCRDRHHGHALTGGAESCDVVQVASASRGEPCAVESVCFGQGGDRHPQKRP
jgi:hypothetical protein